MKINVSIQETKIIVAFITNINFVCIQMSHEIHGVHAR